MLRGVTIVRLLTRNSNSAGSNSRARRSRLPVWAVAAVVSGIGCGLVSGLTSAAGANAEPAGDHALLACLAALANTVNPAIVSTYAARLSDEERSDIRRLSRDYVQDASCRVEVRIERTLVDPALTLPDLTFDAPPQPVSCEIKTSAKVIAITGTFSPRVTFKHGLAVDGTPGLANVSGVNAYLAWPVIQYVNRAPGIRKSMLAMINAYRASLRTPAKS
jgi:hypothetical protein